MNMIGHYAVCQELITLFVKVPKSGGDDLGDVCSVQDFGHIGAFVQQLVIPGEEQPILTFTVFQLFRFAFINLLLLPLAFSVFELIDDVLGESEFQPKSNEDGFIDIKQMRKSAGFVIVLKVLLRYGVAFVHSYM